MHHAGGVSSPQPVPELGEHIDQVRRLEPGVYGLSNGLLDSGWPKQRRAADELHAWLARS